MTSDAFLLDTSNLSIEESVDIVYEIVKTKLKERSD
jgi:cytidylate kinase